jgi:hypothetical protein
LKSEVYYSRNILIVEKTHDKKKEEEKPKLSGEKNVSRHIFRVLIHFVKYALVVWYWFEIGLVAGVPEIYTVS